MKQHIWCLTIWLKDYLDYDKYPFNLPQKNEFGWTLPITDWAIDQPSLHKKGIIHLTAGLERTQSGKWHLQSVVCYKTPKTFKHVQKQFPGAHIEFAKGTLSQNIAYCTKEGSSWSLSQSASSLKLAHKYSEKELAVMEALKKSETLTADIKDAEKQFSTIEQRLDRVEDLLSTIVSKLEQPPIPF